MAGKSIIPRCICWRIDAAGVVFCLAVSAGAYFGYFSPLVRQQATQAQQQQELSWQQETAAQLEASVSALEAELRASQERLADSKTTLKPMSHVNRQVADLTELLNSCGLKTDSIELEPVIAGNKYDIVPVTFTGTGSYKAGALFLQRLSDSFPDTGVCRFELSGNPQSPDEVGGFKFALYWYAAAGTGHLPK